MASYKIGGSLIKGVCGCGKPVTLKQTDKNGRQHYRNRCYKCISIARLTKKTKCEWCGYQPENKGELHVDHIDRNPSNNSEDNLQTLCVSCHEKKTVDERRLDINVKEMSKM